MKKLQIESLKVYSLEFRVFLLELEKNLLKLDIKKVKNKY